LFIPKIINAGPEPSELIKNATGDPEFLRYSVCWLTRCRCRMLKPLMYFKQNSQM